MKGGARAGRTISLVLGSGGARGLAHVGVLRALDERGFSVRSISGCSIGALVGGVYAAGKLDEYEAWARKIDRRGIFSLLDFSLGHGGLVKGEKLMAALRDLVGDIRIDDLPIPFTAVASDIVREREVWISEGSLFDAVRASISIPLFFTPFVYRGVRLVDGGVFNPVPIAPTFRDLNDLTVAVSTNGPARRLEAAAPAAEPREAGEGTSLSARIRQLFGRPGKAEEADDAWDISFVVSQSFDAMQGVLARQKLAEHPPDVLIEIPQDACGMLEFDRAEELIALGYERACERLDEQR